MKPVVDRKIFTVTEANRAIPALSRLVQSLQERFRWMGAHRARVDYVVQEYRIINEGPVSPEYYQALISVRRSLRAIEKMGAQVKDIGTGLVDFPARFRGKDVLLCWKLGEDRVGFWHDLQSGFAGRQPLPAGASGPDDEGQGS